MFASLQFTKPVLGAILAAISMMADRTVANGDSALLIVVPPFKVSVGRPSIGTTVRRRPIHALTCRSDRCFTRSNPEWHSRPVSRCRSSTLGALPGSSFVRSRRMFLARPARGGGQDRARSSGVGFYETKAPSDRPARACRALRDRGACQWVSIRECARSHRRLPAVSGAFRWSCTRRNRSDQSCGSAAGRG